MRTLNLFSLSFALFFFAIEKSGLWVTHAAPAYEILHSYPVLVASLIVAFTGMASAWSNRARLEPYRWLALVGVVVIVAGLWTSWLVGFHGEVVLTEDQELEGRIEEFQQGHVWLGKLARVPFIGLKLSKVTPRLSRDGSKLLRVEALFDVFRAEDRLEGKMEAGDVLPHYFQGMFITVGSYGFSPRYSFRDGSGAELDSSYVYLNVFPPGTEDYFRLLTPHTFYVRYYPSSASGKDGRFDLRVVRNKDLLFNGSVHLHESAPVDNVRIRFEEVHQWTKVSITKDPGIFVIAVGGLLLCLSGILVLTRQLREYAQLWRLPGEPGNV